MAAGTGVHDRRFDSGRVCLDLVATGAGPGGRERLDRPARLAEWLVASRLVPYGTPLAAVDETWAARFRQLRAVLDRLMASQLGGDQAETALDQVNAPAAGPPPGLRAVRGRDGALVRVLPAAPACDELLAAVARDAVDLLTDPVARHRRRVRAVP